MSQDLIISWVSTAVAVVTAVVMAIKAFRTTPGEKADVAGKYEAMAMRQAEQIEKLKVRIDELEQQVDRLENWAKRLANHLIAVGEDPDPIEVK